MPTIAPVPTTAPNPLAAAAPQAQGGDATAFARQLERAQGQDAAAQQPSQATQQAAQDTRAKARADAERPNAAKAEKPASRSAAAKTADDGADGEDRTARTAQDDDDSATPVATDAAVLLASLLNRAVPAPGRAAAAGGAAAGTEAARAAAAASATDSRTANDKAAGGEPASVAGARMAPERADTGPSLAPAAATDGTAFQQQLQAAQAGATHAIPAEQAAAATPAPYAAQIQAPVGSPDFAPGLSAQVSLMVKEGLQEARLQLNPAEMGPITVQIQIDGTAAQVTMTAEQAPTRDALEQAMPALAGALREEGLTLTGGGVFEQPRQAGDGAGQAQAGAAGRSGGRGAGGDGDAPAAPARQATPRGMVDLFA